MGFRINTKETKKTCRSILIIGILCLALMACNNAKSAGNDGKKFDVSYSEWADNIGLFDNADFSVESYKENSGAENSIEIFVDHPEDLNKGYEAINNVVKAHNSFVENNPDYFNKNIDIKIAVLYSSAYEVIYYSNVGTLADAELSGIEQDAKIDYVELNVSCAGDLRKGNVSFDFPYVILNVDRGEINVPDAEDNYQLLECCSNYSVVFIETLNKTPAGKSAEIVATYNGAAQVYTSNNRKNFERIS